MKLRKTLWMGLASLAFLCIPIIFSPEFSFDFHFLYIKMFQFEFFAYCLLLIFFFVHYFIFIPSFYNKKKYLSYAFMLVACFIGLIVIPIFTMAPTPNHHRQQSEVSVEHPHHERRHPPKRMLLMNLRSSLFVFALIILFSLYEQNINRLKATEKNQRAAELAYLKSQVNPHFIFNTLNSIYSMAIRKSEHTAQAIVQLSGLMRYTLIEAKEEFVHVQHEFDYIRDYITLQQGRLGNSVDLKFKIGGNTENLKIAPLLLIPFIENAFKHGVNAEENSKISINLVALHDSIQLIVANNKVNHQVDTFEKSGLGLDNTKKRLELMYAGKYSLDIQDLDESFNIDLKINLL